jgi:AcrR family transcriptional regulator
MASRAGLSPASITEAAAALADADWRQEVTISGLARHLGVRPPSLYNHLGGQDELRSRLAEYGLHELTRCLERACVGRAGGAALTALGQAYRDFALTRPGLYWATLRPRTVESTRPLLELLYQLLSPCERSQPEKVHFLRAFRSALHGFVSLELLGGFQLEVNREESFALVLSELIRAL